LAFFGILLALLVNRGLKQWEKAMLRLALLFLFAALILGAVALFYVNASGTLWTLFGTFLILAIACVSIVLLGLGGKYPMD
jgi:formate hydrogenlyase subunit 4